MKRSLTDYVMFEKSSDFVIDHIRANEYNSAILLDLIEQAQEVITVATDKMWSNNPKEGPLE